jgi:polar amino acid transport system ATP-binding protein
MLTIKNITKRYQNKPVLDDISLTVKSGEIAVLLGSSGVGKSTLLRVLNGLETPNAGHILLNGTELDVTSIQATHKIGMVFQHFNLFEHMTVLRNITFALEKSRQFSSSKANKHASVLLKEYGLWDKKDMYASSLSGGQKQRLAIARTIAMEPDVICLDEPTSALDPELTNYIAEMITHLAQKGYVILIATHDTTLLEKLSCHIYIMKAGKILESAQSYALHNDPSQYPAIKKFIKG